MTDTNDGKGIKDYAKELIEIRRKRKIIKRVKRIVYPIAILLFTFLLLISPLFKIKRITVSPVESYSKEQIEDYLSYLKGRNGFLTVYDHSYLKQSQGILSMRMSKTEDSLLFDFPYLKSAVIEYSFPHTLKVTLKERTPVFIAEAYGTYLHIDSEGYLLGTYTAENRPDMPVVKGIDIGEYKIGMSINKEKNESIDAAIRVCNMLSQVNMLSYIDLVDVTDYNSIWLYYSSKLSVKLGSTDKLGSKLSTLKGIIDDWYKDGFEGVIDMSSGGNPVFSESKGGQ